MQPLYYVSVSTLVKIIYCIVIVLDSFFSAKVNTATY